MRAPAPEAPAPSRPALAELVARTEGLQPWRRVFHATNGVVFAFVPEALGLPRGTTALLLGAGALVLLLSDLMRLRSEALNALFFRAFRLLASPREARGIASSTWYAVGIALSYALFDLPVASAAILVLALADPAASVIGRLHGRTPFGKGSRLGSLVFAVVAFSCLALRLDGIPLTALALVALVVAVVEVLPLQLDDNLSVPLATGGALWIVSGLIA